MALTVNIDLDEISQSMSTLTILEVVEKAENVEEEIDEIQVETDSAHNKFIRGQLCVDDVGVVHDVTTKEEASTDGHDKIHCFAEWDENSNKASHHHGNESAKQEWSHAREVILRLESEQRKSDENTQSDQQGLKYDHIFIEGNHNAESKCFH